MNKKEILNQLWKENSFFRSYRDEDVVNIELDSQEEIEEFLDDNREMILKYFERKGD